MKKMAEIEPRQDHDMVRIKRIMEASRSRRPRKDREAGGRWVDAEIIIRQVSEQENEKQETTLDLRDRIALLT